MNGGSASFFFKPSKFLSLPSEDMMCFRAFVLEQPCVFADTVLDRIPHQAPIAKSKLVIAEQQPGTNVFFVISDEILVL